MTAATTSHRRHALSEQVAAWVARAGARADARDDAALERLALEVFAFQFETLRPYQKLCRALGQTPATVTSWHGIPAVPALAFKQYALFADAPEAIVRTFRSSGTSQPGRSSEAHFSRAGLELMDAAVVAAARTRLFPDGRRTRILVLAPPPERAPHSIMVHGMDRLIRAFGLEGSRFVAGPDGLDFAALFAELDHCQHTGVPVSLLGSSFGFVHFFDWMESQGRRLQLAAGSRLMDAGGYKGRSREIGRTAFVGWAAQMCGVPAARVINLLGMTELASQIYDEVDDQVDHLMDLQIDHHVGPSAARMKQPPPWVRTWVIDPRRPGLEQVGDGELGLLRHLDLANVERPMVIQSEDIGRVVATTVGGVRQRGFEILGRARGAEARGCSLTADDLAARPSQRADRSAGSATP